MSSPARLYQSRPATGILWWFVALATALTVPAALLTSSWLPVLPLAAAALLVVFYATVMHPPQALAAVLILLGAAGLPLGAEGFDLGIRVYPLDFLVAVILLAAVVGRLTERDRWEGRWPLQGAFVLLLAWLTLSLLHGLAAGNDPRTALGDYRRMALYALPLFVLAAAIRTGDHVRLLLKALLVSAWIVSLIAAVRIATGTGYAEATLAGTTLRYLSYVEASTAGLGVLVAAGIARASRGRAAALWLVAGLPPFIALLASNYRTAWVSLAIGLVVQSLVTGFGRGLRRLLAGLLLLVPVTFIVITRTGLGRLILDRFDVSNIGTSGLWRLFSWRAAFLAWLDHPVFGTGMGYAHAFEVFNLDLAAFSATTTSSIHNDPLWFLVNNGIAGVLVASVFLVPWLIRARRLARSSDPHRAMVGSTAMGGMSLMLVVSSLQPFFSTAATVAIAAALVAIVLRTPLEGEVP